MLKCAPYIKNLCSSLQSGLWKDGPGGPGASNKPSSLPGSPIRRPRHQKVQPPSPTRSEGGAPDESRPKNQGLEAVSMPVLVLAKTTDKEGEVITTAVKSSGDFLRVHLNPGGPGSARPESPDVTRPAKRLELASNNLGAIAKVRQLKESPTTSTTSSSNSSNSPK